MLISGTKPGPWAVSPSLSSAPWAWDEEAVIFPLWDGATAFYRGQTILPTTVASFAPRSTEIGRGYGQDTDDSSVPKIKYPSTAFDRGSISNLTLVCWCIPSTDRGVNASPGNVLVGNTTDNDDGIRAFIDLLGDARWRLPEAAGTVDDTAAAHSAGDVIQYVGLLGGGNQRLEIWNATTKTLTSAQSATTASITFDEGNFWIGQRDDETSDSFPGDILAVYLILGKRWSPAEILRNRMDPFGPIRPREDLALGALFHTAAAGGGANVEVIARYYRTLMQPPMAP